MGKTTSCLILIWGCFCSVSTQLTDTQDTSAEVLPPPAAPTPPPAAAKAPTPPPVATPEINSTSKAGFDTTSTPPLVAANMTAKLPPVPSVGRKTAVKDASQQDLSHLAVLQVMLTSYVEVRNETITELINLFFQELNLDPTTLMATITKIEKVRDDP
ncbi:hypothetical protein OJAV_G00033200 [Oryzias javanicus]|uniref:Uncharacterized protein n=1 Tax=Oryzias javanicus TaxID=123683 RepID=A0A3S2MDX2_ORYJA|nr:hypothetical protein OJAV_G00033200 [Oryzias javanicus]